MKRIAAAIPCSSRTVHVHVKAGLAEAHKRNIDLAEKYLYEESERLELLYSEAYEVVENAAPSKLKTGDEIKLLALEQCRKIRADYAKLWGLGRTNLGLTDGDGAPLAAGLTLSAVVLRGMEIAEQRGQAGDESEPDQPAEDGSDPDGG